MIRRVALFLLFTLGAFTCACHYLPIFVLSRVEVSGALPGQGERLAALLEARPGANLLDLDLKGWADRILADQGVDRVQVKVDWGGVARASVELKHPELLVDTQPVCGLTDRFVMLPLLYHQPDSTLPLVSGVGGEPDYYRTNWSSKVRAAAAFVREWREQLGDQAPQLSEIHVTAEGEIDAYLWPDRLLIRLGRGGWQKPLHTLKPILAHLGASERTLDLRFVGQVVEVVQGDTL